MQLTTDKIPSASAKVSSSWRSCADSCGIATFHSRSETSDKRGTSLIVPPLNKMVTGHSHYMAEASEHQHILPSRRTIPVDNLPRWNQPFEFPSVC